jgi:hypothetical protein
MATKNLILREFLVSEGRILSLKRVFSLPSGKYDGWAATGIRRRNRRSA